MGQFATPPSVAKGVGVRVENIYIQMNLGNFREDNRGFFGIIMQSKL